jgi:hypothetical protein
MARLAIRQGSCTHTIASWNRNVLKNKKKKRNRTVAAQSLSRRLIAFLSFASAKWAKDARTDRHADGL